jgi:hypothetical protein
MSTEELKEAVRLDINQTLSKSDKILHICGNLIIVDEGHRVQLMHQTVRDFLMAKESGDYIKPDEAYSHLALRCLEQLNNPNFTPQRTRRHSTTSIPGVSAFDDYAFGQFSHHLAHSGSLTGDTDLLTLLASFMSKNLLTWIERTATAGRLSPFKKAIENLRIYLNRYSNDHSPLEPQHQMVSALVDDFARILAIFGPIVVDTPSSIYNLIPIICPSSSLFHKQFGSETRQRLICNFNELWDERLSCLLFPARALCVACNDHYVAVGMTNGDIRIHRAATFELQAILKHGEPVRRLILGTISNVLVSGSPKRMVLWDSQHTKKWSAELPLLPLSLHFDADESSILVPVRTGVVLVYRATDGHELTSIPLMDDSSDSDSDDSTVARNSIATQVVRFGPELM